MNANVVAAWVARTGWAAVGVLGWTALDGEFDGSPGTAVAIAAAALWLAGVFALAVPSVLTLTLARVVVPLAVPSSGLAWAAGADSVAAAGALLASALTCVAVGTAEFGQAYAQASAYGHERRFPLRPPPAYLLAACVAWLLSAAGLLGGLALGAAGRWVTGAAAIGVGAAVAVFAWPRWYRLSRRWLVVVPAGLVVHDQLVLGETLMMPRSDLATVALAPVDTTAADLTGPAPGHPLEVRLHRTTTAILAATPKTPRGTAIHLTACLVAPSRPGQALAAVD